MSQRSSTRPTLGWSAGSDRRWLRADVLAGLTLAAYAIPVSLAYASLAGLPPHCGIYCYLFGGLAYAALGTSRQLAIGPTSAIAMLVGSTVAGMASGDPARQAAIAALTALMVGVLCAVSWWLRLSALMSFVGETILVGFKAGAALSIALTQLPKLLGVPGGGDHFFERLWILLGQVPETNAVVLGCGLAALALLWLGGKVWPGGPIALIVVVLSIVVMSTTSLGDYGVAIVGELPQGLPALQLPNLRLRDVDGVLPLASACFLLSYIESLSAARTLAARHGDEIDARQELLALGAANVAAAVGQGFPVAGGLSQSAVNDKAGAQTTFSLVVASLTLAICLLFLTGLLRNLPSVVLAAILLVAVKGLIDLPALRRLRAVSRNEFRISMVAFIGVLLLGILKGVLVAAVASLLMLLSAAAQPHVAFLGRIPGTRRYSDRDRHPENEALPGVLIFRVESSILYFNAEHVEKVVLSRALATEGTRLVIADLSNSPYVDVAGARMLSHLHQKLAEQGVAFRLAEAHAHVRDLLRLEGLEARIGHFSHETSVDQILGEFAATHASAT
jgi:SulP family sulfate permease